MKSLALPLLCLVALTSWVVLVADAPPAADKRPPVTIGTHSFTLPEGFEIELVAGPPRRARRLDLLVHGRCCTQDLRAARQETVQHEGVAHLPLPARWQRPGSRHDRRHG